MLHVKRALLEHVQIDINNNVYDGIYAVDGVISSLDAVGSERQSPPLVPWCQSGAFHTGRSGPYCSMASECKRSSRSFQPSRKKSSLACASRLLSRFSTASCWYNSRTKGGDACRRCIKLHWPPRLHSLVSFCRQHASRKSLTGDSSAKRGR